MTGTVEDLRLKVGKLKWLLKILEEEKHRDKIMICVEYSVVGNGAEVWILRKRD